MNNRDTKVYIAMSGGVDSSVAAAILKEQNYNCQGVFMVTHEEGKGELEDAQKAADRLGIELDVVDMRNDFTEVVDYFCREYSFARTPNPCVLCNRKIKFGKLWDYAKSKNADRIATGHYIKALPYNGQNQIYCAADTRKDQSYILSMVKKEVLEHVMFPIGSFQKAEIREMAGYLKLGLESKPDSQEICFIPENNYTKVLENLKPSLCNKGKILFTDGSELGVHQGIHKYTIGQRRGLGIAMGDPVYVVKLDHKSNTVILGGKKDLMTRSLVADKPNWLIEKIDEKPFKAIIKIRYNHRGAPGRVFPMGDKVRVEFNEEVSAVTPGQTAVFYRENIDGLQLLGGAWIESAGEIDI